MYRRNKVIDVWHMIYTDPQGVSEGYPRLYGTRQIREWGPILIHIPFQFRLKVPTDGKRVACQHCVYIRCFKKPNKHKSSVVLELMGSVYQIYHFPRGYNKIHSRKMLGIASNQI